MQTSRRRRSTLTSPGRGCAGSTTGHIHVRNRLALVLALGALLYTGAARAALVLFEDGRHLHVKDFEVVEDEVSLRFDEGGSMTIPLERISRIIDDEVDHTPPPPAAAAPETKKRATRSVRTTARPKHL